MKLFLILGIVLMALISVFFYFYLRRTIKFWWSYKENKVIHRVSIVLAVVLGILGINLFSSIALIILHTAAVQVVWQLIYMIVVKCGKDKISEQAFFHKLYRCGLLPIVITALCLTYGYFHMRDVVEKEYIVKTEKALPADGYKVAMLSDLHFGTTMDGETLQKYCNDISAKNPDFIALCGDIVDESTSKEEMKQAAKVLGTMKSKYGIFYVFGNHDPATFSSHPPFTVEELAKELTSNGIQILDDKLVEIGENLLLAGRNDRSVKLPHVGSIRMSSENLLKTADKNKYILLLDHQPVSFDENAAAGVDLQLSGHTHGGQIWPVGLFIDLLGFGEMNYGEKEIGSFHAIVSSGIAGWGYPIRTGHDSEYLIVNIVNK